MNSSKNLWTRNQMMLSKYARSGYVNKLLNSELCDCQNCCTSISMTNKICKAYHIAISTQVNTDVDLEKNRSSFLYTKIYYCQSVLFKWRTFTLKIQSALFCGKYQDPPRDLCKQTKNHFTAFVVFRLHVSYFYYKPY